MADEAARKEKLAALAAKRVAGADGRGAAPAADKEEIKRRNLEALAKRKKAKEDAKKAEASRPLPEGWRRVESRSRPGEFVYENIHTEERQAWFPETPAEEEASAPMVAASADEDRKAALKKKNLEALRKRQEAKKAAKEEEMKREPPAGWKRVESRSRPGEFVYENTKTGERQAWFPDAPVEGAAGADDEKKKKNAAALEAWKKKKAEKAAAEEAAKVLPEGWLRVESRSRPGEFVYENKYTEERQAWFPEGPAEKPLPPGWRKVESRTYPGEFVYENMHTFERQAWLPTEEAPLVEGKAVAPVAAAAAAPEPAAIVCKAKAMYDYTASNAEEEIDLLEGDVIHVEYKAANGWWVGINTRTQKNGIFPGTYVEEI